VNIYDKLNSARVRFQNAKPKMSGENKFAGYQYFELSDILPVINALGEEMKFSCLVSFTPELATLSVIDTEKPEDKIVFTSPMSSAALKGCHEVQNLGAVETYIKRYLYQNAFEIVESDALNGTQGDPGKKPDAANGTQGDPGKKPDAPGKADTSEFVTLKGTLMDWLAVSPPVFNAAQIDYAEKAMADKNIANMKAIIAKAVEKSRAV
jgi:hypothetical protein